MSTLMTILTLTEYYIQSSIFSNTYSYVTGSLSKKMESEELPQYAALCSMAMAK